jgi:hypothetical protein
MWYNIMDNTNHCNLLDNTCPPANEINVTGDITTGLNPNEWVRTDTNSILTSTSTISQSDITDLTNDLTTSQSTIFFARNGLSPGVGSSELYLFGEDGAGQTGRVFENGLTQSITITRAVVIYANTTGTPTGTSDLIIYKNGVLHTTAGVTESAMGVRTAPLSSRTAYTRQNTLNITLANADYIHVIGDVTNSGFSSLAYGVFIYYS